MTVVKAFEGDPNAVNTILKVHDLSMSKNPSEAAHGRSLKAFMPVWDRWTDDEIDRKSHRDDVIAAMIITGLNLIASTVVTMVGPSNGVRMLKEIRPFIISRFDDIIDVSSEDPPA